jgi:hypothetical protein
MAGAVFCLWRYTVVNAVVQLFLAMKATVKWVLIFPPVIHNFVVVQHGTCNLPLYKNSVANFCSLVLRNWARPWLDLDLCPEVKISFGCVGLSDATLNAQVMFNEGILPGDKGL